MAQSEEFYFAPRGAQSVRGTCCGEDLSHSVAGIGHVAGWIEKYTK